MKRNIEQELKKQFVLIEKFFHYAYQKDKLFGCMQFYCVFSKAFQVFAKAML